MKNNSKTKSSNFLYTLLCNVFFNSEYERSHFYYNLSSVLLTVFIIIFWIIISISSLLWIYSFMYYPDELQNFY